MDSRTEAFLAEAKRLSLSPEERAEVRQVLGTHQAASTSLSLDPAEKVLFRRKLKESMHSQPEPWWQFLLQLPQLSLPVAGLAVFLLVFATGSITSLRWLTEDTPARSEVTPADLESPNADTFDIDGNVPAPNILPKDQANEAAGQGAPAAPARAPKVEPAPQAQPEPAVLEPKEETLPVPTSDSLPEITPPANPEAPLLYRAEPAAAEEALPAADSMMMEAQPMMMKTVPTMMQMQAEDESIPGMMRMMKGGCGTLLNTGTGETLSAPETASGELLR